MQGDAHSAGGAAGGTGEAIVGILSPAGQAGGVDRPLSASLFALAYLPTLLRNISLPSGGSAVGMLVLYHPSGVLTGGGEVEGG